LAPALAEEALFRGAVLGAWRGRTGAVVSAVLFGAYHTSVYRMLPATLLGLALGWVRLAGDSLWAAVAFHAVNNAAVVVMARQGLETLPSPAQAPLLALSAAASLAGGLALLRQTNRRTQRP
jgi:membrane protease YdiL (CAAX protease family)